jgi:hypothetical protein
LKPARASTPVGALPAFNKQFVLASDKGIGAVLIQDRRPIAFLSQALGPQNQGRSTYEKEFTVLLTAVHKCLTFTSLFLRKTDHESLKHPLEQGFHHTQKHKEVFIRKSSREEFERRF